MAITASLIKELRERTGAGMMDCKRILTETDGDIEAAIEELRKRGAAAAEKKAGRIAAEGIVVSAGNESCGLLIEINCETDFVAKDESFKSFAGEIAQLALSDGIDTIESLMSAQLGNNSVEAVRQALITKIGENISIRRLEKFAAGDGVVSSYIHGSRIGVLVKLDGGNNALGRDIAMHIAASRPLCISENEMSAEVLEKEREIFIAQARDSGKPPEIIEKMVDGRMKKFLKENTLLGQPFVKNTEQTVGQLVNDAGVSILNMARFEVGEGLEKRSDDFVAEVMAQAGSA